MSLFLTTPLFLMLAASYYDWTGDREFIESLLPNIKAAIEAAVTRGEIPRQDAQGVFI